MFSTKQNWSHENTTGINRHYFTKTVKGNKDLCIRASFGTKIKQRIKAANYRVYVARKDEYFGLVY